MNEAADHPNEEIYAAKFFLNVIKDILTFANPFTLITSQIVIYHHQPFYFNPFIGLIHENKRKRQTSER